MLILGGGEGLFRQSVWLAPLWKIAHFQLGYRTNGYVVNNTVQEKYGYNTLL